MQLKEFEMILIKKNRGGRIEFGTEGAVHFSRIPLDFFKQLLLWFLPLLLSEFSPWILQWLFFRISPKIALQWFLRPLHSFIQSFFLILWGIFSDSFRNSEQPCGILALRASPGLFQESFLELILGLMQVLIMELLNTLLLGFFPKFIHGCLPIFISKSHPEFRLRLLQRFIYKDSFRKFSQNSCRYSSKWSSWNLSQIFFLKIRFWFIFTISPRSSSVTSSGFQKHSSWNFQGLLHILFFRIPATVCLRFSRWISKWISLGLSSEKLLEVDFLISREVLRGFLPEFLH